MTIEEREGKRARGEERESRRNGEIFQRQAEEPKEEVRETD